MSNAFGSWLNILNPPPEYHDASRALLRALCEAVCSGAINASAIPAPRHLLNITALVGASKLWETAANDVYAWLEPYPADAVAHVLAMLSQTMDLDRDGLSREALHILRRLEAEPKLEMFGLKLPELDLPDPDWENIGRFKPDRKLLLQAMDQPSDWMTHIATNMLSGISFSVEDCHSLLHDADGRTMRSAALLVAHHQPEHAECLLVDRLKQKWPKNASGIFEALATVVSLPSDDLIWAIGAGSQKSVAAGKMAARVLLRLHETAGYVNLALVRAAIDYWKIHEKPSPKSGIIPESPRSQFVEILVAQDELSPDEILDGTNDSRSDVREIFKKHLLQRVTTSSAFASAAISKIAAKSIHPALAAAILHTVKRLAKEDRVRLEPLLLDSDASWRAAAMAILREPLFERADMEAHARRLAEDDEQEIRTKAKALLASDDLRKS